MILVPKLMEVLKNEKSHQKWANLLDTNFHCSSSKLCDAHFSFFNMIFLKGDVGLEIWGGREVACSERVKPVFNSMTADRICMRM